MHEKNLSIPNLCKNLNYKYSLGSLYKWRDKENIIRIKAGKNDLKYITHNGSSIKFKETEEYLLDFVQFNIKAKIPVKV